MVLALRAVAVPVVVSHVGGFTALGEYVGSIDPRVTGWWFTWRELVAFGLAFGLSIAAAPYEMTRYYSMRDVATVRYAIGISMVVQALIGASVMILGIGMRGLFPYLPSPDQASSIMASTVMSPLLGSLFLVAMLSAIMSTVNSILLVTGGAFAHDLYKRLVNPQASQQRLLIGQPAVDRRARASSRSGSPRSKLGDVQTIVIEQAKFIASFFFVPVVLGSQLAARDAGRRDLEHGGGLSGCLIWTFTLQRSFASHGIDSVEVGVALSAVTFILVSRATPPTPAENLAIFFEDEPAAPAQRAH